MGVQVPPPVPIGSASDLIDAGSNGIGTHLSLVEQKQQALKQLKTQLEDHPLYDEFHFDALERAETLLAEVHDPSGTPLAMQQLDRILQRWALQRRKWRLLQTLRQELTPHHAIGHGQDRYV